MFLVRMFKLTRNPCTGELEWAVVGQSARKDELLNDSVGQEDRDEERMNLWHDIALSNYGDMLHDSDRNDKYASAIQRAIQSLRKDSTNKAEKVS